MVQRTKSQGESLYGTPQPIQQALPAPVVAKRAPTTADTGYSIGQAWCDTSTGLIYGLASNTGGVATWLSIGGSLTPAVVSLVTGAAATATTLAGNTWSATGTDAKIHLTLTPKGGFSIIANGPLDVVGLLSAENQLSVTGDSTFNGNAILNGELQIPNAGNGIQIAEGVNARMGQAVLVGGTITVLNTSITANTRIFISRLSAPAGAVATGNLAIQNVVVGTSFDISSLDPTDATSLVATDTSTVNWLLIEAI